MRTMRKFSCWFFPLLVMLGIVTGCEDPQNVLEKDNSVTETGETDQFANFDTSEMEDLPYNGEGGCELTLEDDAEIDKLYEYDEAEDALPAGSRQGQLPPPTPYYQLPFPGGERYRTEIREASHVAWDFNRFGTWGDQDCDDVIFAAASGRVITAVTGSNSGFGQYLRIRNDADQIDIIYAHLKKLLVKYGQWVDQGQAIGLMGNTGDSTACHLHLEMRRSGNGAKVPLKEMYFVVNGTHRGALWGGEQFGSRNQGEFDITRNKLGAHNVGIQETHDITRVHSLGWSLTYYDGNFGKVTMYYEALGCEGDHYCPRYNNTNSAWLVRGGIRAKYFSMGGPNSWLGFPTGNEYAEGNGQRQNFRCGYLFWNSDTGVTSEHYYGCP